jgi:hypothetical protein
MKQMLVYMIKEIWEEFKVLNKDNNYLRQCMREIRAEQITMQENMKEISV